MAKAEDIKTLDEAAVWYLEEKKSDSFMKGDEFFSAYHILDVSEGSESSTMYLHYLCKWVFSDGETASEGAGVVSVTFDKEDDRYVYEKSAPIDHPEEADIPQRVKDDIREASYFDELQTKIDQEVADFLKTSIS